MKGRIGVLIEEHFDQTAFKRFNAISPKHEYHRRPDQIDRHPDD
jgi:hypothetical protein